MSNISSSDPKRDLLRHTLATVAYRGGKALRNAPPHFSEFRAGEGVRTPGEILAHLGDLFDWALSIARGKETWNGAKPLAWEKEVERFFAALEKLDRLVASDEPLHASSENLFQGPIADALTHVGQIVLLRRLAGATVKSENYYRAEILAGRVGAEQTSPKREF
ncbi:MAG: hypothetical protein WB729_17710 [Candidatus Sulfotelmatobacter sp.]